MKKRQNSCTSTWGRINEVSLSPKIKYGAAYVNSRMTQLGTLRNKHDTAILMNEFGKIAEGLLLLYYTRDNRLINTLIVDLFLKVSR